MTHNEMDELYKAWRKAHNLEARARTAWRNRQITREQLETLERASLESFNALPAGLYELRKPSHMDDNNLRRGSAW